MPTSFQRPEACPVTPTEEPLIAKLAVIYDRLVNGYSPANSKLPVRHFLEESIGPCDGMLSRSVYPALPCQRCPARLGRKN